MRLHNFFVGQKIGDQKEVLVAEPSLVHQWRHVLRLSPGDRVVLLDDSGFEYTSKILELAPSGASLSIEEKRENKHTPTQELFLFQSLIKKDKFEWVLEKGTELGVTRFMPIHADRSEKKSVDFERAKKIITEASEQCGRGTLPRLYETMKLEEAFGQYDAKAIVFHPDAARFNKLDFIKERRLAVFIGPEGGWSDRELELFTEKKVPTYSFSSLVLRSETAAIAISSLILL